MPDAATRPTANQPWCMSHQELIDQLRHDVYGNGKPGIKQDVENIKTTMRVSLLWLKGIALLVALPQVWRLLVLVAEK